VFGGGGFFLLWFVFFILVVVYTFFFFCLFSVSCVFAFFCFIIFCFFFFLCYLSSFFFFFFFPFGGGGVYFLFFFLWRETAGWILTGRPTSRRLFLASDRVDSHAQSVWARRTSSPEKWAKLTAGCVTESTATILSDYTKGSGAVPRWARHGQSSQDVFCRHNKSLASRSEVTIHRVLIRP